MECQDPLSQLAPEYLFTAVNLFEETDLSSPLNTDVFVLAMTF